MVRVDTPLDAAATLRCIGVMRCLRLPFTFDVESLRADLARVAPAEWIPHVNRRHYDGTWSGAALRSIGGSPANLIPDPSDGAAFHDTPLLGRCACFRAVLATLRCPLQSVRLLRLHAGSSIAEHVDRALDFEDGEVRLHVPIVTSDDVAFFLDGARLVMAPGECWYANVNLPHSVENRSAIDRVHLVIDCRVDAWLRDVFAAAPEPAPDRHAASLSLDPPPAFDRVLRVAAEVAALSIPPARFAAEGTTLVLAWRERHTWQLRLSFASPAGAGFARLESSPDPEKRYCDRFECLLRALAREFPGLTVRYEGLA